MKKFYYILPILFFSLVTAQEDEEDINMDDLWDTILDESPYDPENNLLRA